MMRVETAGSDTPPTWIGKMAGGVSPRPAHGQATEEPAAHRVTHREDRVGAVAVVRGSPQRG